MNQMKKIYNGQIQNKKGELLMYLMSTSCNYFPFEKIMLKITLFFGPPTSVERVL